MSSTGSDNVQRFEFILGVPTAPPVGPIAIAEIGVREGAKFNKFTRTDERSSLSMSVEQPMFGNMQTWYLLICRYKGDLIPQHPGIGHSHAVFPHMKQLSLGWAYQSTDYKVLLFTDWQSLEEATKLYRAYWHCLERESSDPAVEKVPLPASPDPSYCGGTWFNDAGQAVAQTR